MKILRAVLLALWLATICAAACGGGNGPNPSPKPYGYAAPPSLI